MKKDSKAIVLSKSDYIDLSAQLRDELVFQIDDRYINDHFVNYSGTQFGGIKNVYKGNLYAYLIAKVPCNYMLSGKLLQGVKAWFNMYDNDRLSVIHKFKTYYTNTVPLSMRGEGKAITIAFCRFLISELLSTLAESRWQALIDHSLIET